MTTTRDTDQSPLLFSPSSGVRPGGHLLVKEYALEHTLAHYGGNKGKLQCCLPASLGLLVRKGERFSSESKGLCFLNPIYQHLCAAERKILSCFLVGIQGNWEDCPHCQEEQLFFSRFELVQQPPEALNMCPVSRAALSGKTSIMGQLVLPD